MNTWQDLSLIVLLYRNDEMIERQGKPWRSFQRFLQILRIYENGNS